MPSGNNPIAALTGLVDAAVLRHGPTMLERGGPTARAMSLLDAGLEPTYAAALAARQGKGHLAELVLAAEQSVSSGLLGGRAASRPNPLPNDPHVDIEVLSGRRRVSTAQVGVGSLRYVQRKARTSQAKQLVINVEARAELCEKDPVACARTQDMLKYRGSRSNTLSGERVESDARAVLEKILLDEPLISSAVESGIALGAGLRSFVTTAGAALLGDVVERVVSGRPFDGTMIRSALQAGWTAGVRTGVQTLLLVDQFLRQARAQFNRKLLHALGRGAIWAGAVADVIVSTASDLVSCFRGEIPLSEVLRRAGVHAFTAAGAAAGVALAARLCRGQPWWVGLLACSAGALLGGTAGREVGQWLLGPVRATSECSG